MLTYNLQRISLPASNNNLLSSNQISNLMITLNKEYRHRVRGA